MVAPFVPLSPQTPTTPSPNLSTAATLTTPALSLLPPKQLLKFQRIETWVDEVAASTPCTCRPPTPQRNAQSHAYTRGTAAASAAKPPPVSPECRSCNQQNPASRCEKQNSEIKENASEGRAKGEGRGRLRLRRGVVGAGGRIANYFGLRIRKVASGWKPAKEAPRTAMYHVEDPLEDKDNEDMDAELDRILSGGIIKSSDEFDRGYVDRIIAEKKARLRRAERMLKKLQDPPPQIAGTKQAVMVSA